MISKKWWFVNLIGAMLDVCRRFGIDIMECGKVNLTGEYDDAIMSLINNNKLDNSGHNNKEDTTISVSKWSHEDKSNIKNSIIETSTEVKGDPKKAFEKVEEKKKVVLCLVKEEEERLVQQAKSRR